MNNKEYYQAMKPELDYYLWNNDASPEERKCARMWVKDGHWIDENDHETEAWIYEGMDFLMASREAQYHDRDREFTDSYYDPVTQEYIRKLNPTQSELRKLRTHIRAGGRFADDFIAEEIYMDYITFLRSRYEIMAGIFDAYFQDWITKYGAEFLTRSKLEYEFVRFLESKEDYIETCTPRKKSAESGNDLPF